MSNDPTVKAMMRDFEIPQAEAEEVVTSFVSVAVEATKPEHD
jgi:hypothetical protein